MKLNCQRLKSNDRLSKSIDDPLESNVGVSILNGKAPLLKVGSFLLICKVPLPVDEAS
jgi:hypothetical protein